MSAVHRVTGAARGLLGTPLRRRLLLVDSAGLAAIAGSLVLAGDQRPSPAAAVAALALLTAARFGRVPLRIGERRVLVACYAEGPLLLTLLLVPGSWPPLLVALVTLIGQLPRRLPAWRALFNVCAMTAPTAAACLAFRPLYTDGDSIGRLAVGLVTASLLFSVINLLAVTSVVAAAHDDKWLAAVRADLPTELRGILLQAGCCVLLVGAWTSGQFLAVLLLPVIGLALVRQVMRQLPSTTAQDALLRLEKATAQLSTLDPDTTAAELLHRAEDLFGVEDAWIVIPVWPDGLPRHWRLHPSLDEARDTAQRRTVERDLHGPGGVLGHVAMRFVREPELSSAEQQVLNAFLATVATTLRHCHAYAGQSAAARRDSLTGLGNRLALEEALTEGVHPRALVLLDLDHFKEVNDNLGHGTGDRLLREVAYRLRAEQEPADLVARLGGDEFVVLLGGLDGREPGRHALDRATELLAALNRPYLLDGLELPLEASVGVSLDPSGSERGEELLRQADVAMYQAKAVRNSVVLHRSDLDAPDSLQLLGQLQGGLRLGELEVHYQRIVNLTTSETIGCEALVRWRHPQRGLLLPGLFIPIVEQTALILPLTLEVLDQAVASTVVWRALHGRDLGVAVNVSPRCLLLPGLIEGVLDLLEVHGLPAAALTLEITETLALGDFDAVETALGPLRAAGVLLSLDDFGTGYSTMSALRRLTVHEVKVDRSFVAAATTSPADRSIIEATLVLAAGLDMTVVAEGIETADQLELVRALGCHRAQGYLLGRPEPAPAMTERLGREAVARQPAV